MHKRWAQAHPYRRVFDFGAGKRGKVDVWMAAHDISYWPYDPFNRSERENAKALLNAFLCDVVFCANVLNVVEDKHMHDTLQLLWDITNRTNNRQAFVSVYHNRSRGPNLQRKGYIQRNQPLEWYVPLLEAYFTTVVKVGDVLVCTI